MSSKQEKLQQRKDESAAKEVISWVITLALAVVAAGVDHGAAPLYIQVHHLVGLRLGVQAEPGGAEDQAGDRLVQSSYIQILHPNRSPLH